VNYQDKTLNTYIYAEDVFICQEGMEDGKRKDKTWSQSIRRISTPEELASEKGSERQKNKTMVQ